MRDEPNKNTIAVYDLLYLINKSRSESNDVMIAKKILENRYDLNKYSLDKLSEKTYFSQASLSRFIKKMGYKNYSEFKNSIMLSNYVIEKNNEIQNNLGYEDVLMDVTNSIAQCLSYINDLDQRHIERVIEKLKTSQTIIFMGSELSMAITHLLQMALISLGKEAYVIFDYHFQNELLQKIDDDSLIVVISLEQRAYKQIRDNLFQNNNSNVYKMLWTIDTNHEDIERFDDFIIFGGIVKKNMGYWQLMYFILLMYKLLLNESK